MQWCERLSFEKSDRIKLVCDAHPGRRQPWVLGSFLVQGDMWTWAAGVSGKTRTGRFGPEAVPATPVVDGVRLWRWECSRCRAMVLGGDDAVMGRVIAGLAGAGVASVTLAGLRSAIELVS